MGTARQPALTPTAVPTRYTLRTTAPVPTSHVAALAGVVAAVAPVHSRIEDKAGARDSARVHCPDSQALTATTTPSVVP